MVEPLELDLSGNTGEGWTEENRALLETWAAKAASYRWLHRRTSSKLSKKSQMLTIIIAILSYFSGGSILGSTNLDNSWFKYLIGYAAVLGGILTNVNGLLAWKELADKHKVISTKYSSYERSITSMLVISERQRANAVVFINLKMKEMDQLISDAPNIPSKVVKEYEDRKTKKKLTDFWIVFYYLCCSNKRLLKILTSIEDEEDDDTSSTGDVSIVSSTKLPKKKHPILSSIKVEPVEEMILHENPIVKKTKAIAVARQLTVI